MLAASGWKSEILHHRRLTSTLASLGFFLQERGYENRFTRYLVSVHNHGRTHRFYIPLGYLLSLFWTTGRMTIWAQKKH